MKLNKKVLVGIGIAGGILLLGGFTYAEELKESLELYLQDPSLDFLGHEFEKLLFEGIKNGDSHFVIEELKFVLQDIKTMPQQAKAMWKIIHQKPNIIAYGSLGTLGSLKAAMGAKAFNKAMWSILKSGKHLTVDGFYKTFARLLKF